MKKLIKLLFVVIVLAALVGVVGAMISKKKFESMSEDEIRAFLASKLDGKVSEEQMASIQEAVIAGVRSRSGSDDEFVEEVQEVVEELHEVAVAVSEEPEGGAASDDIGEKAAEIIEAVAEAADEAVEEN